ncbi:MAG: ACP S-malonyltransferase [Chromatiales bacterium]|nr:ACP S-malonyltransferase [Chromatiales bacterium]
MNETTAFSRSNLAFVFPGQGSQSVGMMSAMQDETLIRDTFREASDALGFDLWALIQDGPESELGQTHNTQPAMLTAGVALWRLWCQRSPIRPAIMAGHSLGEYTALVCADALKFDAAVRLVAERGRLMQEAVAEGEGAMAAILGLDDEQVGSVCSVAAAGQVVAPVNFNSPGQVVIAGHRAAVERAAEAAKEAGAKRALMLPVSVPSHCSLMEPAAIALGNTLAQVTLKTPSIPVLHNYDVQTHSDPNGIREALTRQLHRPVRWVESVQAMVGRGADTLIECGPGKVLAGLAKRIDRKLKAVAVVDSATLDSALEGLQ